MRIVVVGGGVAGVSCVEEAAAVATPDDALRITLVSASQSIKGIANFIKLSDALQTFDLVEEELSAIARRHRCVDVVHGVVERVVCAADTSGGAGVGTSGGTVIVTQASDGAVVTLPYDKLCMCTGAEPRSLLPRTAHHPLVFGLRDNHTVAHLAALLGGTPPRRAVLVGNGGIALGLVHELRSVPLLWVIKDDFIGNTFFDASASAFLCAAHADRLHIVHHGGAAAAAAAAAAVAAATPTAAAAAAAAVAAPPAAAAVAAAVASDLPSYDVLPKRTSRRHRSAAAAAAVAATDDGGAVRPAAPAEPRAPVEAHTPAGASLGPAWIRLLHQSSVEPGAAAGAAEAAAAGERVDIVMEAEVVALRGVGDRGAAAALADGAWHAIDNTAGVSPASALALAAAGGDVPPPPGGGAPWPLHVALSNGAVYGADLVLCAMGVTPDTRCMPPAARRAGDGGLVVDRDARVAGVRDVYAAGDAASVTWPAGACDARDGAPALWFQMRLWNQARVAGMYAARAMLARLDDLERDGGGVHYEMFAHVTRCLGFKVVLLGLFNGQGLGDAYTAALQRRVVVRDAAAGTLSGAAPAHAADAPPPARAANDVEVQLRVTPGAEYVKVVLWRGRVIGAMLLGDTDLEEAIENLILNRLPVGTDAAGRYLDLLDPDVDIEDYFD